MKWFHLFAVSIAAGLAVADPRSAAAAEWVRAGMNTNQPLWGIRGGLQFAIPPGGFTWGNGGPRGLIRIGYPALAGGEYDLINFIAIEPVVKGRRGLSELERSTRDGKQGKLLAIDGMAFTNTAALLNPGTLRALSNGVEELTVPLAVERFANGAHVQLTLSQRSDAPDELRLRVQTRPDGAPMDQCVLTATMGNKARTRILWTAGKTVSSHELYPDYRGDAFTDHTFLPLARLPRTRGGDVLIAITNDEADAAQANSLSRFWRYRGEKVTQYWRKPAGEVQDDLRCAVNARFMYWMSKTPIPGGIAFENFELVEKFRDGQQFIFGISRRSPEELLK